MFNSRYFILFALLLIASGRNSYAEKDSLQVIPPIPVIKPYRTFIHIQRFTEDNTGDIKHPIANAKLRVQFPNGKQIELPESGGYWPVGNGQVQEINRIYELPWEFIKNDGFKFSITMVNKRSKIKPCEYEVSNLSEYNRSYVCRIDEDWQRKKRIPEDQLDREAVQIRVFAVHEHSSKTETPKDSIAIK